MIFINNAREIKKEKLFPILVVAIIFSILSIANAKSFLSLYNLGTLLDYTSTYFVIAIGLTFVILIGSIDLSIGAQLSLYSVCTALLINKVGLFVYPIIIIISILIGIINGVLTTKLKIPSFISTFGAAGIYQSIALLLSKGLPIGINPKKIMVLNFLNYEMGIIKGTHILALILLTVLFIAQRYTVFGKHVFAIGNSEKASLLSGIRVSKVKIMCFAINGLTIGLGSTVLVSRMFSGDPTIGSSYTLNIIAAVIVGGTAISGGSGSVFNTLIGALIIVLIANGLNVIGVNVYYQLIITGIVTMIAVVLTFDRSKVSIVK